MVKPFKIEFKQTILIFPDQEEEEQTQKQVQTEFTVKLLAYDEKQKVALIKEVKSLLPDTNLVQVLKYYNRNICKY